MVFQEAYGELTTEQWRLYKKHSITPAEHDMLMCYAENDPVTIVAFLKNMTVPETFYSNMLIHWSKCRA